MASVAAWLYASQAGAFCQTTTCDIAAAELSEHPECTPVEHNADKCNEKGAPLFWPSQCLSFGVQENGSKKRDITWEVTDAIVQKAFSAWSTVDCGGGRHPSLKIYDLDRPVQHAPTPIVCPIPEFNKSAPNANVYMYRDDEWPYSSVGNEIAITTVTFDQTGRILDADVEINSFSQDLTVSDTGAVVDLQSIMTHETGHFLGLGHEWIERATMNTFYDASAPFDFRTLEADDVAAVCAIYPPDRNAPCDSEPLHGFSRYCGGENDTGTLRTGLSMENGGGCACSFDHSSGRNSMQIAALAASAAVALGRLRGRRPTKSSRMPREAGRARRSVTSRR